MSEPKGRDRSCPLCGDTGVMRWMQPNQECTELREMTHPCVNGCGGTWRQPAGERHLVVEQPDPDDIDPGGQSRSA